MLKVQDRDSESLPTNDAVQFVRDWHDDVSLRLELETSCDQSCDRSTYESGYRQALEKEFIRTGNLVHRINVSRPDFVSAEYLITTEFSPEYQNLDREWKRSLNISTSMLVPVVFSGFGSVLGAIHPTILGVALVGFCLSFTSTIIKGRRADKFREKIENEFPAHNNAPNSDFTPLA